jgi:hypothetical protein
MHLPSTLGIGCHIKQAMGILLGHLSGPTLLLKLVHKEGNLPDKAFGIFTSKG